MPNQDNEFTQ